MNFLRASDSLSLDDQILNEYTTEFQLFKLIENPSHYSSRNWKSNTKDSIYNLGNTIIKIKIIIIINQSYYQQIFINRCTNLNAHLAFDNWDIMILKKEPLIYPVLFVPIFSHSRKRESHVLLFANYFQPSLTACFKFHGISRRIITSNAKSYFISPARITDFIHHALLHFRCFSAGGRENNFTRSYRKLRFPQL